ncbi:hypothetical protein D3C71_1792110 [compost metagenome]
MTAGQALLRAVDEYRLLPDQRFGAGIGQRVEQQRGVAGGGMGVAGRGTVKQLIAEDFALFIHDGLPRDDGQVVVIDTCGQGGRSRGAGSYGTHCLIM